MVARACREGDGVAWDILERNSKTLADLILAARKKTPAAQHVLLSGSVFTTDDTYFELLMQKLDSDLIVERLTWPPIWGACLQCMKMCGLTEPSLELFLKTESAGV